MEASQLKQGALPPTLRENTNSFRFRNSLESLDKNPGALSRSATSIEVLSLQDAKLREAIDRVRRKLSDYGV